MAVFESLVEAYASENVAVASGLSPTLHDDFYLAPFTWLVKDGASVTDGLGISVQEIYFLECLAQARRGQKILVIGNAYGWSTLALALANPGAQVLAIDAGYDINSVAGIEVTNRLAANLGLNVTAVLAVSPQDVPAVVTEHLGEVDLVFIDGFHSSEQIVADWRAVRPFLTPDAVVLLHDVAFVNLTAGYEQIIEESGWHAALLHATTTGIGILVREPDAALSRLLTAFAGHDEARQVVVAEAKAMSHLRGSEQRAWALGAIPASTEHLPHPIKDPAQRAGTAEEPTMTTDASADTAGAPGSIGVRELDNARFFYRIGTTDEIVLDSHYGSPRYFAAEYTPREDDTIVDVGAHIGAFAVLAARQVPKGKVFALEPGFENFEIMQRNLAENEADNVTAHKLALGAKTETVRLWHGPGSVGHSLFLNPLWADVPVEPRNMETHSEDGYEEVACQALEEWLTEHGIAEIDYMKMNIEGAEYDVLGKAPLNVLRVIRHMHVELHPEEDGLADALIQRLDEAGFTTSVVWSDDPTVKGWVTAQRND